MSSKVAMTVCVVGLFLLSACATTLGPPAVHQEAEQTPTSVIVQGDDLDTVRAAVLEVGGEITHELGIINSVGANLTPAQLERLNRSGLVRIHENRSVESSSTEAADQSVLDQFNTVSWSGNNGTASWKAPWVEDDAAGSGPSAGNVRVLDGSLRLTERPNTGTRPSVSRSVDLSGATFATFSFDFQTGSGVDRYSDIISVDVSADGVTFNQLEKIDTIRGAVSGSKSYDISAYISAETTVRIVVYKYYGGYNEYFYVDNAQIEFDVYVEPPPPVEGPEPGFYTVMDHFNAVSYEGNDGTMDFFGPWVEEGDIDGPGPADGSVFISEYGHFYMQNSDRSVTRQADLAGATWAQLSFYRWRHYNAWTEFDYVTIEISPDGGATWTELDRFGGPGYDHTWKWMNYNISDYATSEMALRFKTSPDFGADDKLNLANIEIQFVVGDSGADSDAIVSPSVLVEADMVHDQGITGRFNTVAVLDTGYWPHAALDYNSAGYRRVKVQYNAIRGQVDTINGAVRTEENGHGSHVTSVIMNRERNLNNRYIGVAPGTDLASIKAFDRTGAGTYLDVIRGIDWVVQNKDTYDIRVLNCSFSAPAVCCYWDDPLAQAVMAAWNAGIVVVASAGNRGPDPMTIGVPGNVPYVITVGAVSDGFTIADGGDDFLASFSSTGPTAEGFVKPEVVAPGGHVWALMPDDAALVLDHPQFLNEAYYFSMSGTSQATAVVSGIAALMLEADDTLTPDQVKSRIIDSARPAMDANGLPVCSVFEQGAGMVSAYDAVYSTTDHLANNGLDIVKELAGTEHYGGPANQREDGSFYIMDHTGLDDGTDWDGVYSWSDAQGLAYLWSDGHSLAYLWSDSLGKAYLWSDAQGLAYLWSDALKYAYLWSDAQGIAYLWSDGLTESMSINCWVPQE